MNKIRKPIRNNWKNLYWYEEIMICSTELIKFLWTGPIVILWGRVQPMKGVPTHEKAPQQQPRIQVPCRHRGDQWPGNDPRNHPISASPRFRWASGRSSFWMVPVSYIHQVGKAMTKRRTGPRKLRCSNGLASFKWNWSGWKNLSGFDAHRLRKLDAPHHRQLSISRQCALLGLPRSTHYYRPPPVRELTLHIMARIDAL